MNTRSALAGAMVILASAGPIRAEDTDLRLEATLRTAKDHMQRENTVVPEVQLASLVFSGSVCANFVFQITSGGFVFRWCANRTMVSGVSYEVQKDMYESAGSLRLRKQWRLDCQNTTDFQSLPAQVRPLCP